MLVETCRAAWGKRYRLASIFPAAKIYFVFTLNNTIALENSLVMRIEVMIREDVSN